jgi:hypothetical protein
MQLFEEYDRRGRDHLTKEELREVFTKIFEKHGSFKTPQ